MGVVDRRGKHKATIVALVASAVQFLAKPSPFFAVFDSLVALELAKVLESPYRAIFLLTTTTTDGQTNYFTPCVCAWGNHSMPL